MQSAPVRLGGWALVLGASSGFGEASSIALARAGLDIFGVHLDRKATLTNVERIVATIEGLGRQARFFNVNAADADRRAEVLEEMTRAMAARGDDGHLTVLLHSLAFGTLKPFIADPVKEAVSAAQMDMTVDVMAHTLVYWTQEVVARGLMTEGGRIFALTSSGGRRVLPAYGPVSAAKAALESHVRQLAMELAPRRITVNAIRAGVTPTPAAENSRLRHAGRPGASPQPQRPSHHARGRRPYARRPGPSRHRVDHGQRHRRRRRRRRRRVSS